MAKTKAAMTAVNAYPPDCVLSNKILKTMVDTNYMWITTRIGIKERRILKKEGEVTSYIAIKTAEDLIKKIEVDSLIDMIIMATATANRMGLDESKVMSNIHTTSVTLPLLLHDYEKQLKKGDNLLFAAFESGFTWGSIYLKWSYNS